ncbi:hypothetical protein SHIRM173S_05579 [Streptomyces hirsutus]
MLVVPQALLGAEQWSSGPGAGEGRPARATRDRLRDDGGPTHRPAHAVPAPGSAPLPGPAGYGNGPWPQEPQAGTGPYAGPGPQARPDMRTGPDAGTDLAQQTGSGSLPEPGNGTPLPPGSSPGVPAARRHDQAGAPAAPAGPGGVAPPLPLRGARAVRPNPAEAVPGVTSGRPADPRGERDRDRTPHPAQPHRARHHGQTPTAPPPSPGTIGAPAPRRSHAASGHRPRRRARPPDGGLPAGRQSRRNPTAHGNRPHGRRRPGP